MSAFWFARTREIVPNHLLELGDDGRSTICRRLEMLPVEFVVRGYLSGSGWVDYQATGAVCGHALPAGPARVGPAAGADRDAGDEGRARVTTSTSPRSEAAALVRRGGATRRRATRRSRLYAFASEHAEARGIILADTKFEFGVDRRRRRHARRRGLDAGLLALLAGRRVRARAARSRRSTSSTCATSASRPGGIAPTPGPSVPDDVVAGTRARYVEAFERLTGDPVRALSLRPEGGSVKATVLIRPKEGILDPQGEAVGEALRTLGFAVTSARVGRLVDVELDDRRSGRGRARRSSDVARAAREPADRVVHDRARRRGVSDGAADRGRHVSRARTTTATRRSRSSSSAPSRFASGTPRPRCRTAPAASSCRRVLVRRLPPLRCDRPVRAGDGGGRAPSPPRAARCSGSATASRSSARRACCPASCG